MALSLCRAAAVEPPADFCVSRDGRGFIWDSLPRGGARTRARLADGRGWTNREDTRSHWFGRIDLEWYVAEVDDRPVPDERSDLVASLLALSV